MRLVELSDHPGDMLQAAERQRAEAADEARNRYEKALDRHRDATDELRSKRDQARARGSWLTWLGCLFALWRQHMNSPPPPGPTRVSNHERVLQAGMEGERLAAVAFGRLLGDDWALLRGYRNTGGEVDHVLIGPAGFLAVEVKHRNATVHVNGDRWTFDKFDRYGNHVDHGTISDRRGRSPSEQVNQPVDRLEAFLRSRGCPVAIQRAVLLTHPRSALGDLNDLTVHVATSPDFLLDVLKTSETLFTRETLSRVEQLIIRDHHFHARRRA